MKAKLFTLLIIFGLVLFIAPSASALSNPITISNSQNDTLYPQTVTDTSGYLHAVWMDVEPGKIWARHQNPGIFYSRWNGDIWSTPVSISNNTGFAEMPSISSDSTGTVHVIWDDETVGETNSPGIAYRTRSTAGAWSSIETLPKPPASFGSYNTRIAIGTGDIPYVVFDGNSSTGDSIYWTRKVSGSWTTPELVSRTVGGTAILSTQWSDLRSDNSGNIHLVYWGFQEGIFYRSFNGTSWSTPVEVVGPSSIRFTRLATTPEGNVFVTWFDTSDSSIRVRSRIAGVWQTEATLTTQATNSSFGLPIMGVTTDSKNRVHIGWGEFGTNDGFIDLRYRSFSNGAWGTVQDVDVDNQDADSPFIYPDKWDNQHFMWSEKNATTGRWEVKYRLAEGTIQTITTAGGTVTANPNNVTEATLTIPSGALNSTQEITIQVGPVPEAVDGGVVTLPKAYTFRPHGLTFISPITATIFYTDTDVQGVDERDLRPWFWNSITNAWESQIGTNRPSQNRIEVSLSHFSLYGISAPKVHTTFIAPLPDQEVKQGSMMYEFGLSYADGTPIKPITNPEDLLVKLRNSDGTVVSIAQFDGKQLIKGTQQGSFKDVLHFQQDNLPSGEYTLEIYLTGSLMGKQTFFLIK